jgi:hypothetical protein
VTAAERLRAAECEGVTIFDNYSYDDALIGVTECGRAVYDYDKMVDWLVQHTGWDLEEAMEWIEYNTIRALDYAGPYGPLVMRRL